ncbi:hypothetical protein Sru01_15730 [Sphaerisporangium rufum]|uniref:HTH luxR-type domain-containing protein n=1 Tax=Sphaerisporangium rufum TaxID=1381558 RepID=A0A919R1B8_9ACTN|nr:LuxR C-terminal-related transcriptional regulator [Sphaerisporangium rufum]GII76591.1 hypothetical protein Sru01_15730 [Sphaerisporangium rufum]
MLTDVHDHRLAGVSPECRQMLYTAAVLGPEIVPDLLAQMLGRTTAALLPVWEEALGGGLLVSAGGELRFARETLRQAVAGSLPAAIRDALARQHAALGHAGNAALGQTGNAALGHAGNAASGLAGNAAAEPHRAGVAGDGPVRPTARERTVLSLLARGRSNHQIARELGISDHAVKRHVSNLMLKFGCANRTEVALLAVRRRWHEPPAAPTDPVAAGRGMTAVPPDPVTAGGTMTAAPGGPVTAGGRA